jgi:hypothetical protein
MKKGFAVRFKKNARQRVPLPCVFGKTHDKERLFLRTANIQSLTQQPTAAH